MRTVWRYVGLLVWLIFFAALAIADVLMYDSLHGSHSRIPLCISAALTLLVGGIFAMACFETFKHRHDKEEW